MLRKNNRPHKNTNYELIGKGLTACAVWIDEAQHIDAALELVKGKRPSLSHDSTRAKPQKSEEKCQSI